MTRASSFPLYAENDNDNQYLKQKRTIKSRFWRKVKNLVTTNITLFLSQSVSAQLDPVLISLGHLIKPVLNLARRNECSVNFLTGKSAGLIKRLTTKRGLPLVFLTVDAGNLWFADQHSFFKVDSPILEEYSGHRVQTNLVWLSLRARTIVTVRTVSKSPLSVVTKIWPIRDGKDSALRTSKIYNQSLVAMMLASHKTKETERIVGGWVKNLHDRSSNDLP